MTEKEMAVSEIVLKIGQREIKLSVEEAKKLKSALEGLFGKEVIKEVKHEHHYDWYYQPHYYKTNSDWFMDKYSVTCESKTAPFKGAQLASSSLMINVS